LLASAFQLAFIPSSIFAAHGALHAPLELYQKVVSMSKTFDLGYKVEGSMHQKEGHTFKGYSRMEGHPN